jgi:hypothetical protein
MKNKFMLILVLVVLSAASVAQVGAQAGALPLCPDVTGITNPIVRASIPPGTVTGGEVYCRIIAQNGAFVRTSGEIGVASVLEQGVVQAVDVFGLLPRGIWSTTFNASVQVCLQGSGSFIFLDARQSPRSASTLSSSASDGYVCASISGPGTVVLVGGAVPTSAPAPNAPGAPGIQSTPGGAALADRTASLAPGEIIDLTESNCTGRTTRIVRLRAEPDATSRVIDTLAYDRQFRVTGVTNGWVRIVYLNGQSWVSAQFFRLGAGCAF